MGFVIRRFSDSKFVAKSGRDSSYTKFLQTARIFKAKEQAKMQCCENEYVCEISEILK